MLSVFTPPSTSSTMDWPPRATWVWMRWRAALAMLLAAGGSQLRLDIEGLDDPCAPSAAGAHQALQALAGRMARAGVSPAQVAVFPGTPRLVAAARQAFPGAV